MAAKKVKEPKKVYTYRCKPSLKMQADKKAAKKKESLSGQIENFLSTYSKP